MNTTEGMEAAEVVTAERTRPVRFRSRWQVYPLIAAMGFVGAALRYGLELAFAGAAFPWGTLIINIFGSFVLVIINGFVGRRLHVESGLVRAMGVGLLGAFTTLSAFTRETLEFLMAGRFGLAAAYIGATFALCFGAALAAAAVDDVLARRRMERLLRHHREHHEHMLQERAAETDAAAEAGAATSGARESEEAGR